MAVKTSEAIHDDIYQGFKNRTGEDFKTGSVLDMLTSAISDAMHDVYQEIENSKNPHVWSSLSGNELDATGTWVNCAREDGESDSTYRYRLMNWMQRNEASNKNAIQTSLLNTKYSSNITYVPFTRGCGTGTCYVIPNEYTKDTMIKALTEAKERMDSVASPSLYVEYIIPAIRSVSLDIYFESSVGDSTAIKNNLQKNIADYINSLAPNEYMEIGIINKMGANTPNVDYFNVVSVTIDGEAINKIKILQELESKLLFNEINWLGV